MYKIIGKYAEYWEEVTEEETWEDAVQMLEDYNENEPDVPHGILYE